MGTFDEAARLYGERRYVEALAAFRALAQERPGDVDVLHGLGVAAIAVGDLPLAIQALEKAAVARRDHPAILANLAVAMGAAGRIEEPVRLFRRSLALQASASVREKLAAHLLNHDRLDEAEVEYGTLGGPGAAAGLAAIRERQGRGDEARAILRPHLGELDATGIAAWARLCVAGKDASAALGPVEDALATPHAPRELAFLHHAHAVVLDALGRYPEAFAAWTECKRHRAGEARFDPAALDALVTRLLATFTPDVIEHAYGSDSEAPVFIVGLPRSGTSLLEQILACHPDVAPMGEREDLNRYTTLLSRAGTWPEVARRVGAPLLAELAADYLRPVPAGAARTTDKMPANTLNLGLARMLFPRATVIHIRRDPRDTLLSCWQQFFNPAYAWTWSLDGLAAYAAAHERLMAHWWTCVPMIELEYEDLVSAPEEVIPQVLELCGLAWDPACLHPERNRRRVATASYEQVRHPIGPGSIGRWRRYARELEPLIAAMSSAVACRPG